MPRGGKRPGAGAPKGNFNAVRSGNRSQRMLMVYMALVNHPDILSVGRELLAQGLIHRPRGPRRSCYDGDVRPIVNYLYRRWFDCPESEQSHSINNNQPPTLATASVESEIAMARALIAAQEKIAREQPTIKARHAAGFPGIETEADVR